MFIFPTSITDVVACGLPDMSLLGLCAIAAVVVILDVETMGPTIVPVGMAFGGIGVRCVAPRIKTLPLLPALLLLLLLPVIIIITVSSSAASAAASAATSSSAASSLGAVVVAVAPIVVVCASLLIIGALLLWGLV